MTKYKYFSQTGTNEIISHESSTSATNDEEKNYKFNSSPITFNDLASEEKISKEDEVKFYKKVFEIKNF